MRGRRDGERGGGGGGVKLRGKEFDGVVINACFGNFFDSGEFIKNV